MSNNAGEHAVLIFVAVFGGAAIWFGWFIVTAKWQDGKPYDPITTRVRGVAGALGVALFAGIVLSFWR